MMTTRLEHSLARSHELYARAQRVLVGGVNSPVRAFGAVGGEPVFVERAQGAHVFDADGRGYIDLVGSWGPALVGHAHPEVVHAAQRAAARGLSFGACCASEAELAELIVSALPSVERVRFVNSGTEAVMTALRLARAATGRSKVLKFVGCYHGHVDSMLVAAGSGASALGRPDSAGVPDEVAQLTVLADYNDPPGVTGAFEQFEGEIAAVIVEPIAGNMGFVEPAPGFLEGLREACDRNGALLIFDEVMTGFRVAWGGCQTLVDPTPDLTCLGKVIGGGAPVGAVAGPARLMKLLAPLGPVYQAGTLSGNPVAMAAGLATLRLAHEPGFYARLHELASRLAKGLAAAGVAAGIPLPTGARGGMLGFAFSDHRVANFADARACDHERHGRFFHAMLDRGVWLPPSGYEALFVSSAHTEELIDEVVEAAAESLESLPR